MKKYFRECKTEEERQEIRDYYLETLYHQTITQNGTLSNIQERLNRIEDKIDRISKLQLDAYYGVTDNSERGMNFDAISALCEQTQKYCEAVGRELGKYGRAEV